MAYCCWHDGLIKGKSFLETPSRQLLQGNSFKEPPSRNLLEHTRGPNRCESVLHSRCFLPDFLQSFATAKQAPGSTAPTAAGGYADSFATAKPAARGTGASPGYPDVSSWLPPRHLIANRVSTRYIPVDPIPALAPYLYKGSCVPRSASGTRPLARPGLHRAGSRSTALAVYDKLAPLQYTDSSMQPPIYLACAFVCRALRRPGQRGSPWRQQATSPAQSPSPRPRLPPPRRLAAEQATLTVSPLPR